MPKKFSKAKKNYKKSERKELAKQKRREEKPTIDVDRVREMWADFVGL